MGTNSRSTLTNVQPQDVQPNAVDLRLNKVFSINNSLFTLTNEQKTHRGCVELLPDSEGFFVLHVGVYEVEMENHVSVGDNEAGWVITRSTLNRNGLFLTSGLYDSKYRGPMASVLHVNCGPAKIKQGTRIGQYVCFDAEMLHGYAGDYGFNEDGTAKPMEKQYRQ